MQPKVKHYYREMTSLYKSFAYLLLTHLFATSLAVQTMDSAVASHQQLKCLFSSFSSSNFHLPKLWRVLHRSSYVCERFVQWWRHIYFRPRVLVTWHWRGCLEWSVGFRRDVAGSVSVNRQCKGDHTLTENYKTVAESKNGKHD